MGQLLKEYLPKRFPDRGQLGWILLPVVVAVSLLAFDRFAVEHRFLAMFGPGLAADGASDNDLRFYAQQWLSLGCVVLMVVLPALYLVAFPGQHPLGLRLRIAPRHFAVYGVLFGIMLPALWIVAGTPSFGFFYPLYDPSSLRRWLTFEAFYLAQFFCIEFFFRGPLLFRLESRFGMAAVGTMVVPYALIHIYKPIPEALGSIVAGFLLGYLALRIRSIWPGVALHCGIAFTMDAFALLRSGRLAALF